MAAIPPDAAERARTLFGDFIEGRWEEKREEFSQNLRGHADADRIARGWAHTASSAGGFERAASRLPASSASTPWLNSRWPSEPARASDGLP